MAKPIARDRLYRRQALDAEIIELCVRSPIRVSEGTEGFGK